VIKLFYSAVSCYKKIINSLGGNEMRKVFRLFVITVSVIVLGVLIAGCKPLLEGVELGNTGGYSLNDAYNLTEGEWIFGYISSSKSSRYYSIPVTNGNKIQISTRTYNMELDSWMTDVGFYIYRESGVKYSGGPYVGHWHFTSDVTGKWLIEVVHRWDGTGAFALAYTNGDISPPVPKFP
jgi:hypothetical protein